MNPPSTPLPENGDPVSSRHPSGWVINTPWMLPKHLLWLPDSSEGRCRIDNTALHQEALTQGWSNIVIAGNYPCVGLMLLFILLV